MEKNHDIFISFALRDEDTAKQLKKTLELCGLRVYCSVNESYGEKFEDKIIDAISHSALFLAIYTPVYGASRYCDFERGLAVANNLPIFAARTSDVAPDSIQSLPGASGLFSHNISTVDGAETLLKNIFCHLDPIIATQCAFDGQPTKELIEDLAHGASRRTAFIAGSVPIDRRDLDEIRMRDHFVELDHAPAEQKLAAIADDTTRGLLRAGFIVGSWPVVPGVGNPVFRSAHQFAREDQCDEPLHQIGGIWPGYAQQREELRIAGVHLSAAEDRHFARVFADFRVQYLRHYDWVVILGGQSGTREEFNVAREIDGIRIVTVPALGGTGRNVWEDRQSGPFTPNDRTWGARSRQKLIDFMLKPIKEFPRKSKRDRCGTEGHANHSATRHRTNKTSRPGSLPIISIDDSPFLFR